MTEYHRLIDSLDEHELELHEAVFGLYAIVQTTLDVPVAVEMHVNDAAAWAAFVTRAEVIFGRADCDCPEHFMDLALVRLGDLVFDTKTVNAYAEPMWLGNGETAMDDAYSRFKAGYLARARNDPADDRVVQVHSMENEPDPERANEVYAAHYAEATKRKH